MKTSKRILSSLMAFVMVLSVFSVGFTAFAVDSNGVYLDEIVLEPIKRPDVDFFCTTVTRVAKAANSMEPGNQIVKATPSGVPELSGPYANQAYAGETPSATMVYLLTNTAGITPESISIKCSNESVTFSPIKIDSATGAYCCEITGGTAEAGSALVFTADYTWTDGNAYQEKCVSYVENIATGGSYAYLEVVYKPYMGMSSWYIGAASASTRLLGKGVYYEQPTSFESSAEDPFSTYGVYDVSTGTYIENVAGGYNTHLYKDDKNHQETMAPRVEVSYENFITGTPIAHVYIDSAATKTLADINLRLDGNVANLSDRNNGNPYTALDSAWVMTGTDVSGSNLVNDATAQNILGYNIPAKSDKGVQEKLTDGNGEQVRQTITGPVGQFGNLYTNVLTGSTANIADNSSYTIVNKYYSFFRPSNAYVTASPTVATSMVFHVVDKGDLAELLEYVMGSDPDTPTTRDKKKGANPQAWFYKSGFSQFQNAYVEALRVYNNPKATQAEINAATKSLQTMYNGLTLKTADYTKLNALVDEAEAIVDNSQYYNEADIALIEKALDMVEKNYSILYQGAVDTMAKNIRTAIDNASVRGADYSEVTALVNEAAALRSSDYTSASWEALQTAINNVVYGKTYIDQAEVDSMAQAIRNALDNLVSVVADFRELKEKVAEAKAIDRSIYQNPGILDQPIANAEAAIASHTSVAWSEARQTEVNALTNALANAIGDLKIKAADKTALKAAIDAEIPGNRDYYDQTLLAEYEALVAEGTEMYKNASLSINDQSAVNIKTTEITTKYAQLMASYDDTCKHVAGAEVRENEKKPSCTRGGSYDAVVYCTKCGEEISRKMVTVAATGHIEGAPVVKNEVAPTCTKEGKYDTYIYCEVCGVAISRVTTKIPALGHTEGEAVIENEVAATPSSNGSYDTVVYCTVCGGEVSRVTTDIPALGHEPAEAVEENRVEATCTEKGSYDMVVYCTCCAEKVELSRESFEIDALGHKDGEAVVENEEAADCVNDGSYDEVVYCTVCGAEVSRETTTVEALGHTEAEAVEENRVEATYEAAGSYDSVVYCAVCGEELSRKSVEIPMLDGYFKAAEGTTTVLDTELGYIYGLEIGLKDLEGFVDYSSSVSYETPDGIGTGMILTTYRDGEEWENYTIVIFGDLNGDGVIDIYDTSILAAIVNGDMELEEGDVILFAADLNGDTAVDIYDLAILNAVVNGETEITQVPMV